MVLKLLREGAKRLGAATTRGAKRGGTKKGGGSKYYKRDRDTGQVKSLSEKKLTRRGAGVAAAGAGAGAAGVAAASGSGKPKAKAKPSRRGPSLEEAGAKIKKSKEAFERRKRSNRQAESAMRSVQKSRALGEAAARDPKATKPMSPGTPPTSSVKQESEKTPRVKVAVEKPSAPKVEVKPNVVPRVYATPKSNRKLVRDEKAAKRSAAKSDSKEKKFNVGVSKGGVSFKEAFRHFRNKGNKTFTWNGKKYTTELAKKAGGGMIKPKGMRRGGRVMAGPAMPTPPSRRRRGTPTPPPNPNLTAADKKLRAALRGKATPSAAPSLGDIVRRGGKIPTKTPTPNIDGATRRRGKTPNRPPMPKLPGGMKGGGMASKMASKGGARGGKKFPDLTGDGKVTQADILKGRGIAKKKAGGMAKKGYAKGGMAKKGYSKGGAVRGKPRGVGAALRGYGKALK